MDEVAGQPSVTVRRAGVVDPGFDLARARDPVTIVIFGASGDLAKRKLIPALYQLEKGGYLPERYAVVGFSRTPMTDEAYRDAMRTALGEEAGDGGEPVPADERLVQALHYQAGDADDPQAFARLASRLAAIEGELGLPGNRLYYFSVAPDFFPVLLKGLTEAGLVYRRGDTRWSRIIVEKPFGHDLESARSLNCIVRESLDESQIYRIDHYLGKETVQNLLSFRFGNSIFEPLFNQKYVDNVQITVAETLGMEGRRGAYFDTAGTLRDIVQNHVLQLLCLIAMEPPSALEADAIRDEKVKVLRAMVIPSRDEVAASTVRGQYGVGEREGKIVKGYRQEEGVAPTSTTETYIALHTRIDNWRWAGVPFLLRSGKRLGKRVSEIAVQFKQPPLHLFRNLAAGNGAAQAKPQPNLLLMRIQPDEGISLTFACKQPGMRIALETVQMDFFYQATFHQRSPEAYERLLLDALRGDASLFTRSDEVDYAWRYTTAVLHGWAALPPPTFPNYYPFTDGPDEANRLMAGTGASWRPLAEM
jgi:glucose-6-phosphate 1-dehydrogenase